MYTAHDAATGNVITEPAAVYLALTESLFLEDVALTESGIPKFLVFTADPGDYNLILVEASGNDWTETLLFHDQDGWSPEYGVLPHSFHDCRFVAAADDYTQVCLCNTMRISGPLLTTVAMPVVCFVGATGDVSAFLLQSSTQMIFGSLRSRSLGADSMYLWAPGDVLDFYKFVVRSDGTYDQIAYYDHNSCYYGELAGMS
ncbi:MAG: hypothetical protein IPG71_02700 [bacterium]|nr:hypothetical protein [bacterium]